jgi:hypothetical protein
MSSLIDKVKELIPGTEEYQKASSSERSAVEVMQMWDSGETVYSQLINRITQNRDFYLGELSQQFNQRTREGELQIVTNVGATVIDLMVFLLANNVPLIQVKPKDTEKTSQVEASVAEDLANKALRMANFHQTFRNSCWLLLVGGFTWWFPFWNEEVEFGKKKNKFDFTLLNPFTTRVFYEDTDYQKIPYFITVKRLTPEAVYELYDGFEARPDRENPMLPKSITGQGVDDGKVTVFKKYDSKNVVTIIDNRRAEDPHLHGLDFAPIIQTNNKYVVNDAHGYDEIYRMLPVAQELNMLISATSEIARDLGWPAVLEYNGALGGKKLPKMRGNKIPLRRTDKGEGLEYMINPAQMEPLLKQIQLLLDLFHFVSLMPKAAAGIFDSTVTSGFQARIAMQPATLNTENKRVDLEVSIQRLAKIALYLIEKKEPKALEINENTRLEGLYDLEMEVRWPDNLPVDISREIQNLILGIQNSLTSVTQAVDKYNVLMGMGSSEETLNYLTQESTDTKIAPERALKVAQVQQTLAEIGASLSAVREKMNVGVLPENVLPGGNATNATRAMGQTGPEEGRLVPETAQEAVTPESSGGVVIPPTGGTE